MKKVAKVLNLIKERDLEWNICHIEPGQDVSEYLGIATDKFTFSNPADCIVIYPDKESFDEDAIRELEDSTNVEFEWYDYKEYEGLDNPPAKIIVYWI